MPLVSVMFVIGRTGRCFAGHDRVGLTSLNPFRGHRLEAIAIRLEAIASRVGGLVGLHLVSASDERAVLCQTTARHKGTAGNTAPV